MMADSLTAERRSWNMSRIRGSNTKPELTLRSLLHRAGYRFRLHDKTMPGKPDIVLKKHRTAIFVHGCFWHRHSGCKNTTTPSTRADFWAEKFAATVARDQRKESELRSLGWKVITVWECQLARRPDGVVSEIVAQLEGDD